MWRQQCKDCAADGFQNLHGGCPEISNKFALLQTNIEAESKQIQLKPTEIQLLPETCLQSIPCCRSCLIIVCCLDFGGPCMAPNNADFHSFVTFLGAEWPTKSESDVEKAAMDRKKHKLPPYSWHGQRKEWNGHTNDQAGLNWPRIGQHSQKWGQVVKNGPEWLESSRNGPKWNIKSHDRVQMFVSRTPRTGWPKLTLHANNYLRPNQQG